MRRRHRPLRNDLRVVLPGRVEHEESPLVVLAAEGSFFGGVADLDHEVDQILYWEHTVVQDRILRIDSLHERPELVDKLNFVRVHPKI